jgi:hypothetical protein
VDVAVSATPALQSTGISGILDAWETRPFTISKCETLQAPPATDPKEAVEEVEHETVLAHR